jgi:hypothetical protein
MNEKGRMRKCAFGYHDDSYGNEFVLQAQALFLFFVLLEGIDQVRPAVW